MLLLGSQDDRHIPSLPRLGKAFEREQHQARLTILQPRLIWVHGASHPSFGSSALDKGHHRFRQMMQTVFDAVLLCLARAILSIQRDGGKSFQIDPELLIRLGGMLHEGLEFRSGPRGIDGVLVDLR